MRYAQIGTRGPVVSTVGFGAWAIGGMNWGPTDDAVSLQALHTALDEGVTFIDTADVYGFGHSEELIARVLGERGKGDVIVATKAGNDFYNAADSDDSGYGPIRQNCSTDYLIEAAEKSIRRLKVEALDILQLHSPDLARLERDEPWRALERLKQDGKILHAGLSIQSFQETAQAHLLDEHHGLLDVIQVRYNLLEREAEKELFPKAEMYGIGVICRIPLLFGLLTGKFGTGSTFSADDHRSMNLSPEKLAAYIPAFAGMETFYDRYPEQSKAQVSLRFCLSHSAVSTAIPGAKTPAQVHDNAAASDLGRLASKEIPHLSY